MKAERLEILFHGWFKAAVHPASPRSSFAPGRLS